MIKIKRMSRIILTTVLALLLILSTVTGFVMLPQWVYYGVLGFILVWYAFQSRKIKISQPLFLVFLIICALSILINQPPPYFKAWQRLLAFVMMVIIATPVFINNIVYGLRYQFLSSIMWLCIVLSIGSFICYFYGINFFVRNDEILSIQAGHFSGLFCHSMILGPIAGLSAIFTFASYLGSKKRPFWLLVVLICCLSSNLLAASRGAVAACIIGMVIVYIRYYRGNISRGVIYGVLIIGILAATFSLWGGLTEFVVTKQENNLSAGSSFMSRETNWAARISEIRQNPFWGVGFCCVDTGLTYVDTRTGSIEPGSSWLAVFSMTGFFGFITFLTIFIKTSYYAYHLKNQKDSSLLCGFLVFFSIHLLIEGYVLASGSFLGLLYWLLLGCVWEMKGNSLNRNTKKQWRIFLSNTKILNRREGWQSYPKRVLPNPDIKLNNL